MALIGYARVSTEEQNLAAQVDALLAAGCGEIVEERASGGDAGRPALARVIGRLAAGDTLVVARIDRLARSLVHLLAVIEQLRARKAHFRSLGDPIDTSSPQGVFTLQVLGAAAEFERALIRERTQAGLAAARTRGRVGGNPGLKAREAGAVRKVAAARRAAALAGLIGSAETWLPVVRRMRPERSWAEVARAVGGGWTAERLSRATRRFVAEGLAEPELLAPAPRRAAPDRLVAVVAALARSGASMRAMAAELAAMREVPPRGGREWSVSSVAHLVGRARRAGLLRDVTP
jgi:DNA invertase Pin-like site-specific DNA recombinase